MSSWVNRPRIRRKNTLHKQRHEQSIQMQISTPFHGIQYRLASNWFLTVPLEDYRDRPIRYLEIGTFYGANLISVAESYAYHPDSELHCIDPWLDYDAYPEYKGQQDIIYDTFLQNIDESGVKKKIHIHRGYSNQQIPTFDDEYFDIIYVDGNHEPEYVLEDAVLSFRKLKTGGIMIIDDYGWGGPDLTQRGIDAFLAGYHKRIEYLGLQNTQIFIKKLC